MTVVLSDSVINGRFSVHAKPNTAPGKCACCGSVSKPVVDFGFTVDYYGAVLMCGDCILEAHTLLVAMFPTSGQQNQTAPLLHNQHLLDAGTVNEYVRASLDAINRLNVILPAVVLPVEEPTELSGSVKDDAGDEHVADNVHDESVSVEGPDDRANVSGIFDLK